MSSSGSLLLDNALDTGGLPKGRIIEYTGDDEAGITLALRAIAAEQRSGGVCVVVDMSHDLDLAEVTDAGVDLAALLVSQPDNDEQAMAIVDALVRSGGCALVVVSGLCCESDDGLKARLVSQAMRRLCGAAFGSGAVVLFVGTHGGYYRTSLKFYTSVRVELQARGVLTRCRVMKNKLAAPFGEALVCLGRRSQRSEPVWQEEAI